MDIEFREQLNETTWAFEAPGLGGDRYDIIDLVVEVDLAGELPAIRHFFWSEDGVEVELETNHGLEEAIVLAVHESLRQAEKLSSPGVICR